MPPLVVMIFTPSDHRAFFKVVLGVGGKGMCSFDYNWILRTAIEGVSMTVSPGRLSHVRWMWNNIHNMMQTQGSRKRSVIESVSYYDWPTDAKHIQYLLICKMGQKLATFIVNTIWHTAESFIVISLKEMEVITQDKK